MYIRKFDESLNGCGVGWWFEVRARRVCGKRE